MFESPLSPELKRAVIRRAHAERSAAVAAAFTALAGLISSAWRVTRRSVAAGRKVPFAAKG